MELEERQTQIKVPEKLLHLLNACQVRCVSEQITNKIM
jgi:hypothetical protein